jgi:folate-binding protein YgfZ
MLASVLTGIATEELSALPEHGNRRARFGDQPCIILRVSDTGEPGFDILVDRSATDSFAAALHHAGAVDVDTDVAEVLRIEAGIPKFHRDMDEETIPLEAGIESRAISFDKGCYVGQEVIIRVLHRGHGRVARKLVGLTFDSAALPAVATPVLVDGRDVGRITSSAISAALNRPIALAYVGRDFVAVGTRVVVGETAGVVTALPFVKRSPDRPT